MLPTVGHEAKFLGRAGKELNAEQGRRAAYAAALNVLAVARQHLGSLDRVSRVVRLGVYIATARDFSDHVTVADAASELLRDILGGDKMSSRLVFGESSARCAGRVGSDLGGFRMMHESDLAHGERRD